MVADPGRCPGLAYCGPFGPPESARRFIIVPKQNFPSSPSSSLVTHLVCEALLRRGGWASATPCYEARLTKPSFADKCVPKLVLRKEAKTDSPLEAYLDRWLDLLFQKIEELLRESAQSIFGICAAIEESFPAIPSFKH